MTAPVQITTEMPPRLPALVAGGVVRPIVPHDFDSCWRIANAVVKAGMAPYGLNTAEKAMVAIMHGMEVGLTPMNALQSIAVINGKPTIYGDGAIGLVRASGLLEWIEESEEQRPGHGLVAICRVKRRNEPNQIVRTFSEEDAKKAGLWGKRGKQGEPTPWITYPKRMLLMRARAFALRDGFADVLKGLGIVEEVQDYKMRDVTPPREDGPRDDGPPPPPPPPSSPPPADPVAMTESGRDNGDQVEWKDDGMDIPAALDRRNGNGNGHKNDEPAPDFKSWLNDVSGAFSSCETLEQFAEAQRRTMAPQKGKVSKEAWAEAQKIAEETYQRVKEN